VNPISTSILVLTVTFTMGITAAKAQQSKRHPCSKIGDAVIIRGHIIPGLHCRATPPKFRNPESVGGRDVAN
jgi:hypothetical protein